MNKLVAELRSTVQKKKPHRSGRKKNKHEYDSDEDTEGGTWEHKARMKEMIETHGETRIDFLHYITFCDHWNSHFLWMELVCFLHHAI